MKDTMWKNGEVLKKQIKLEGSTIDRTYFDVAGKKLCIVNNGRYSYVESCTCTACAIYGGLTNMGNLCSYKIALHKYLPIKND